MPGYTLLHSALLHFGCISRGRARTESGGGGMPSGAVASQNNNKKPTCVSRNCTVHTHAQVEDAWRRYVMNKNHTAECARACVRVCMCIIIITESMNDTVYLLPIQSARPDDADIILVCIRHAHACAPHEMYTHTRILIRKPYVMMPSVPPVSRPPLACWPPVIT